MNSILPHEPLPPSQVNVAAKPTSRLGLNRLTPMKFRSKPSLGTRPRVLVVDDDRLVCVATLQSLTALGYRAYCCVHPEEALWHLKESRFDVVLSDFRMPVMTGLELASEARKSGSSVPFVLMTGQSTTISNEDLEQSDVCFVLRKPFPLDELGYALKTFRKSTSK